MATATITPPLTPPVRWNRRAWWIVIAVAVALSAQRAGLNVTELFNTRGFVQFTRFFAAMVQPELSWGFVKLAIREAGVTLGFAILGTALSVVMGIFGGLILAERLWLSNSGEITGRHWVWRFARVLIAIPRSMHEVVFGLILVNILGLNPLVAILSIGIPFGSVTAKVFAELLDEAPRDAEQALRASGAGRLTSVLYGAVPHALGDILSYGFYRFECAIRSAAVLGLVGAGGLGFQLALSFQTLRYNEMWTLLWALIILSGLADRWSSVVRKRRNTNGVEMHATLSTSAPRRDPVLITSAAVFALAVPISWWWLGAELSSLWSSRARILGAELAAEAWPPQLGDEGFSGLLSDSVDTIALALLSLVAAWSVASVVAFISSRTDRQHLTPEVVVRSAVGMVVRLFLLIARSVPPPVWAFLTVFIFKPGLWPGVAALAIYNLGVLGRLQGEVVENIDDAPGEILRTTGASAAGVAAYATIPAVSGRFVALGLYRWEVAIRETVTVGVVGAAGLGRTISEQSARFDYNGILASIMALIIVTLMVDFVSSSIRRTIR
jgi:phosphonate transport system permease protein